MAKGAAAKAEITQKLLETFQGSFVYDGKTLVIPWEENGETVHIKVAMTCSKTLLEGGDGTAPAATGKVEFGDGSAPTTTEPVEMTQEEKDNVEKLLAGLGLT